MCERAALQDRWLKYRLDVLLPELMRRADVQMWIVVAREYNEGPVIETMLPTMWLSARRRTILVFYDRGPEAGVEHPAVTRYAIGNVFGSAWGLEAQPDQWRRLTEIVAEHDPASIALNRSDDFGLAAVLTYTEGEALLAALPEDFRERKLTAWFHPSVSVRRAERDGDFSARPEGDVIQPGDLLHVDFGITYLGLNTDTQQHTYVLWPGEAEAPEGLRRTIGVGNRLQDVLTGQFQAGRTGNEILKGALAQAHDEGINATIYTHPIGFHGHAAEPTIGLWDQQGGVHGPGGYLLYPNTAYSIELNAAVPTPEWGEKTIRVMLEEDTFSDGNAVRYIDGRQTELLLIPHPPATP